MTVATFTPTYKRGAELDIYILIKLIYNKHRLLSQILNLCIVYSQYGETLINSTTNLLPILVVSRAEATYSIFAGA